MNNQRGNGKSMEPVRECSLTEVVECDQLRKLFATGFDSSVTDETLLSYFSQFGCPQEINIYEEYETLEDSKRNVKPFVYCEVKMSKFLETVQAVNNFNKVYHQHGLEKMVVMRYKPRELRDIENKFVPNGVELVDVEDTSEAKRGLQSFLEDIPTIKCVSILLLTPEQSNDAPRFNVYLETSEMADVLILLGKVKYPITGTTVRMIRVPRNAETMSHGKAMKEPFSPPLPVDPELNKTFKCQFDVKKGFQDGYRKSMNNIQEVIQGYLAGGPSAVADIKKLAEAINKMAAKPTPSIPSTVKCQTCPPRTTSDST